MYFFDFGWMVFFIFVIKRIFINVFNFIDKKVEIDNFGFVLGYLESSIYGIYFRFFYIDYRIFENIIEGMKVVVFF